jgi:hypothetical protein
MMMMMMSIGQLVECELSGETELLEENSAALPLCPP